MSEKSKKFVIKEATRKRCKVLPFDEQNRKRFMAISLELFHYIEEAPRIDFSIFFRAEDEIIEFIKPNELSAELLTQMWNASLRPEANVEVCVLKTDYPKFESIIDEVRTKKIKAVLDKDHTLDPSVLDVYATLSTASQMIVRGGITNHVANRAISTTAYLMSTQIDSEVAIGTLSRMITCDSSLYDHSASVAMISAIIASQFLVKPLPTKECELVAQCGLYHDAGKVCIPNHILNKPGSFTDEEYDVMKTHTIHGHRELLNAIAKGAPIEEVAARVALEHHERFTGTGYPYGRKGRLEDGKDGIHLYARIVMIADVYSALLMKRVYKEAMSPQEAITVMTNHEIDYDPAIFGPFREHILKSLEVFKEREEEEKEKEKAKSKIRMIDQDESFAEALLEANSEKAQAEKEHHKGHHHEKKDAS